MQNKEKLEGYLINLSFSFQEVAENNWLINDAEKGLTDVVVTLEDPLVILRVRVMEVPTAGKEVLYETLLKLNASDIVHGAYGIEENFIILTDTLLYQTLDIEEFQASLDSIGLALSQHYPVLSKFRKK